VGVSLKSVPELAAISAVLGRSGESPGVPRGDGLSVRNLTSPGLESDGM
jgi:hypothetical protein